MLGCSVPSCSVSPVTCVVTVWTVQCCRGGGRYFKSESCHSSPPFPAMVLPVPFRCAGCRNLIRSLQYCWRGARYFESRRSVPFRFIRSVGYKSLPRGTLQKRESHSEALHGAPFVSSLFLSAPFSPFHVGQRSANWNIAWAGCVFGVVPCRIHRFLHFCVLLSSVLWNVANKREYSRRLCAFPLGSVRPVPFRFLFFA